jgi:hypothetical protein
MVGRERDPKFLFNDLGGSCWSVVTERLLLVSPGSRLNISKAFAIAICFNTYNRKTGNRVKHQFIDAESGEVVADEDQVKGYEIARGQYITVEGR